jgi:transposase
MHVSSTIARLEFANDTTEFDAWLVLTSIGNKVKLKLPIKLHKHYHKLDSLGTRQESYIISRDKVQLSFQTLTEPKKTSGNVVGIDTGIKSLATLSNGTHLGTQVEQHIDRIQRKQHGSKGQHRARINLRQYIDEVVKQIPWEDLRLIVVENIKNIARNTKGSKRFVIKKLRKMLGNWNYRYWLRRLQYATELHRVSFRSVSPYQTSIRCSSCGHTEQGNRPTQGKFLCRSCGYTTNADVNAAKNILERFTSGPYGARFKPDNAIECNI